jgi:hypothetical protein
MYEKRMANIEMLSPVDSPMKLRFTRGDAQIFELHNVWFNSGYELDSGDQPTPNRQIGGVQLIAYDPIWKWTTAPLETGQSRDSSGRSCVSDSIFTLTPQLVLPFVGPWLMGTTVATETWTVVDNGSWPVSPTIKITGPVEDWTITNVTTGNVLTWDGYQIASGEVVTLDIPAQTVTNNAALQLTQYVGGDFSSFKLNPGTNTLTFWAAGGVINGTTTVQICWYTEILGI